jgi:hypothetical protein
MGEIKSTLDIVMEKTKHLSMTDEEKLVKEKEEIRSAVKGLIQKYQDQTLNMETFRKALEALHQQYNFEDKDIVLNEIFSRFDLETDNTFLFELIKEVFHIDPGQFEQILNQYLDEMKDSAKSSAEVLKNEIKEKHSISGLAVVPNIEADLSWQTAVNDITARFHLELDEVKSRIVNQ